MPRAWFSFEWEKLNDRFVSSQINSLLVLSAYERAMLPHCVAQGICVVLHLFKKECSPRMRFLYVAFCDLCEVVRDVSVAIFRFVGPT